MGSGMGIGHLAVHIPIVPPRTCIGQRNPLCVCSICSLLIIYLFLLFAIAAFKCKVYETWFVDPFRVAEAGFHTMFDGFGAMQMSNKL